MNVPLDRRQVSLLYPVRLRAEREDEPDPVLDLIVMPFAARSAVALHVLPVEFPEHFELALEAPHLLEEFDFVVDVDDERYDRLVLWSARTKRRRALKTPLSTEDPSALERVAPRAIRELQDAILGRGWTTPRASEVVERVVGICSLGIIENELLRSWIAELCERRSELEAKNADLAAKVNDLAVYAQQLESVVVALRHELRLSTGPSPRARQHVGLAGRLASILDQTVAAVLGGLLVLGLQTGTTPPSHQTIVNIGQIGPYCLQSMGQLHPDG